MENIEHEMTQSQAPVVQEPKKKKRELKSVICAYILLGLAIVIVLIPAYIAIITSLMTRAEANYVSFH